MNAHPDLETLAELADGSLAPTSALELRVHLARCRSCAAAYVDAVRYRAAWLARPELFAARDPDGARADVVAGRRVPGWSGVATAAAAAAVIVVGTLRVVSGAQAPTLRFPLTPAVLAASERSSSRGLVLPGGERLADRPAPTYRSGFEAPSVALEHEVDALLARYERGDRSAPAATRVVAGLLAIDDLEAARVYADEALQQSPRDVALLTCVADVHYRDNDLPSAEQLLRTAIARAPRDPIVDLDLALVLRARGELAESRALLQRASNSASAPIAARAQHELAVAPPTAR